MIGAALGEQLMEKRFSVPYVSAQKNIICSPLFWSAEYNFLRQPEKLFFLDFYRLNSI
jgi:hypothetical protein